MNIKYNMDQNKNIKNNIEMNVEDFFKEIEKENDNQPYYRYIHVELNKEGKKDPTDEYNDWSTEQIKKDRGDNRRMSFIKGLPKEEGYYWMDGLPRPAIVEIYRAVDGLKLVMNEMYKGQTWYELSWYKNHKFYGPLKSPFGEKNV